jgi:hypothetical protein
MHARWPGPLGQAVTGIAWPVFGLSLSGIVAWLAVMVVRDRFTLTQLLFWVPAASILAACGVAALSAWALPLRPRTRQVVGAVIALAALVSGYRFVRYDFGWALGDFEDSAGALTVMHWNTRSANHWSHGYDGVDRFCGALARTVPASDVAIVSGPGDMASAANRAKWLPSSHQMRMVGPFALVSRLPVVSAEVLALEKPPGMDEISVAWVEVDAGKGAPVRILVLDLPSNPRLPRIRVANALESILERVLADRVPDMVVGDTNCTPGSVVLSRATLGLGAAPPWRAYGWLCTFERRMPLLKIDAMVAGNGLAWAAYETMDLGIGEHRAQRGRFGMSR